MIEMRLNGIPVQYILGHCKFMDIDLDVGPGVLIPRDDTEVLVQKTIDMLKNSYNFSQKTLNIIDLCSGTGAIALSIKKVFASKANVTALDFYEQPLKYLKSNTLKNNLDVKVIQGSVFTYYKNFIDNQIDCIISNPPYIPTKQLKFLHPDVQYEPTVALDGGADGLDFYRVIAKKWINKIKQGGIVALEIGINQKEAVCKILKTAEIKDIYVYNDINNIPRVLIGKK